MQPFILLQQNERTRVFKPTSPPHPRRPVPHHRLGEHFARPRPPHSEVIWMVASRPCSVL